MLAIEPPLVMMPETVSGSARRLANQRSTACSTAFAAGERCQRLQFWFSSAVTWSAQGLRSFGEGCT
jgi:hypothetical protein